MSDISQEIAAIQSASRGSEIRSPIVDALNKMNAATLPAVTSSDSKKILCVNEQGQWVASNEQYVPTPTGTLNISENGTYNVAAKASAVVNVPTGPTPTGTIQITQNGTYDVTDKASAEVNVQGGSSILVPKTITQNGTYDPASDNADGYSGVTVNVPGGGTLIQKTITQNGTYNASSDNADGYSQVTVNVQGGGPPLKILDFDFTQSLVDRVYGYEPTVSGATLTQDGILFSSASDYLKLNKKYSSNGFIYEFDVVEIVKKTGNNHGRFLMSAENKGFIWRSTGVWSFYGDYGSSSTGKWASDSNITDPTFFDDSTIKIIVDDSGYWHIYKDDVLVYEPNQRGLFSDNSIFSIGSSGGQSMFDVLISGMRVYFN